MIKLYVTDKEGNVTVHDFESVSAMMSDKDFITNVNDKVTMLWAKDNSYYEIVNRFNNVIRNAPRQGHGPMFVWLGEVANHIYLNLKVQTYDKD